MEAPRPTFKLDPSREQQFNDLVLALLERDGPPITGADLVANFAVSSAEQGDSLKSFDACWVVDGRPIVVCEVVATDGAGRDIAAATTELIGHLNNLADSLQRLVIVYADDLFDLKEEQKTIDEDQSRRSMIARLFQSQVKTKMGTLEVDVWFANDIRSRLMDLENVELREGWTARIPSMVDVPPVDNDNPNGGEEADQFDIKEEARAFARIAASRSFRPPLAVGVFGDWGSGKTFFMGLIHERVRKLAEGVAPEAAAEAGAGAFHRGIVQIRFNAWHYIETNLWASLVDHIFTEIDRAARDKGSNRQAPELLSKLDTAQQLSIEAAEALVRRRRQHQVATKRLADATKALADARAKTTIKPRDVLATLIEDPSIKKEMTEVESSVVKAASIAGIGEARESLTQFRAAIDGALDAGSRGRALLATMAAQLGSWRAMAVVVCVMLAGSLLLPVLKDLAANLPKSEWLRDIQSSVLALAGMVAAATGIIGGLAGRANAALNQLDGFRQRLDRRLEEKLIERNAELKTAKQSLVTEEAAVLEAEALLKTTSERLAETTREFVTGSGRVRLLRFIRERAANGDYAKHLGIVAAIRRDFEQLATLLDSASNEGPLESEAERRRSDYDRQVKALIESAGNVLLEEERKQLQAVIPQSTKGPDAAAPGGDLQGIHRIILYIDDLDRCPPKHVVEVLQAIHLLLTFPLFVVFVAVDARWVSRALHQQYPDLLDESNERNDQSANNARKIGRGGTAHDYLEKIFQIPYWVRPMTEAGSRQYVGALIDRSTAPQARNAVASDASGGAVGPKTDPGVSGQVPTRGIGGQSQGSLTDRGTPASGMRTNAGSSGSAERKQVARALALAPAERAFMRVLAPAVAGSPRRALRFVNTYRIARASLAGDQSTSANDWTGYRPLMTQIAIATGAPGLQRLFLDHLGQMAADASKPASATGLVGLLDEKPFAVHGDTEEIGRLRVALVSFASDPADGGENGSENAEAVRRLLQQGVAELCAWSPYGRRYSFLV